MGDKDWFKRYGNSIMLCIILLLISLLSYIQYSQTCDILKLFIERINLFLPIIILTIILYILFALYGKKFLTVLKKLKNKVEKYRNNLAKYSESFKLCLILLTISLLIFIQGFQIFEILKLFIGKISIYLSIVIILIVLYVLFALFSEKSSTSIYFIFPLFYIFAIRFILYFLNRFLNNIELILIIFLGLLIIFIIHIWITYKLKKSKLKIKQTIFVLIIITIFLIGTILIFGFTNEENVKLGLGLNICHKAKRFGNAELECGTFKEKAIVGSKALCKLKNIKLNNTYGHFNFTLVNGSYSNQSFFNNTISFIAPVNVSYAYVEINGIHNGKEVCLSSGYPWRFATYEEYKKNKKDFGTYFIGLIGFILISAPIVYKKWEEMFSSN